MGSSWHKRFVFLLLCFWRLLPSWKFSCFTSPRTGHDTTLRLMTSSSNRFENTPLAFLLTTTPSYSRRCTKRPYAQFRSRTRSHSFCLVFLFGIPPFVRTSPYHVFRDTPQSSIHLSTYFPSNEVGLASWESQHLGDQDRIAQDSIVWSLEVYRTFTFDFSKKISSSGRVGWFSFFCLFFPPVKGTAYRASCPVRHGTTVLRYWKSEFESEEGRGEERTFFLLNVVGDGERREGRREEKGDGGREIGRRIGTK